MNSFNLVSMKRFLTLNGIRPLLDHYFASCGWGDFVDRDTYLKNPLSHDEARQKIYSYWRHVEEAEGRG
jgi:hypothetical protein